MIIIDGIPFNLAAATIICVVYLTIFYVVDCIHSNRRYLEKQRRKKGTK